MNCYEIQNPTNGQTCKDDLLGNLVFNAEDGTWEKREGYTKDGNNWSFNLNSLPRFQTSTQKFTSKYGVYLIGAGIFLLVLVAYSLFSKK